MRDRRRARPRLLASLLMAAAPCAGWAQSLDWQTVSSTDRSALRSALEIGAEDTLPLFACRVQVGSGVQTGRYRADFDGCHVGYAGKEVSVSPFEVLAAAWQDGADGSVPAGSFPGGVRVVPTSVGNFRLTPSFPCRASYQGNVQVGEIAAGDRGCVFGFGGRQVTKPHYQVLWQAPWMSWVPGIMHQIPRGAVPGGWEGGEAFYLCRASDHAGLHVGKLKQSLQGCSFASEGEEVVSTLFNVLAPRWVDGNAGTIPGAALPAGRDRDALIYLCRAQVRNTVQIGRIADQLVSCQFGMLGSETSSSSYEVLSAR